MDVVPGYEPLAEVFQIAHDQAARGKGLERHANAKPFLQQPIFSIGRMVGVGYNVGQAMKKGQESMRLPDDRAQAELLGAMVYLASAYLLIGERMDAEKRAAVDAVANGVPYDTGAFTSKDDAAHKAPSLCDSEVETESCNWVYSGECSFTTGCGFDFIDEGSLPLVCPYCGRERAVI